MPGPSVQSIFPSDGSIGVVLGAPVTVTFDREVDITTISGNFIVEGPDTDRWTGPDMALLDRPETSNTENILDSPDFKGIVQGEFSYELLDVGGDNISGDDTSGASGGNTIYRHKVTFTPTHILSPTTEYVVYISGEEDLTDAIDTGIATRTVFGTVSGLNVGDGLLVPAGGYIGDADDVFRFQITKSGDFGVAEYEWYRDSDTLTVRTGIVSQSDFALPTGDGVSVSFSGLGSSPFSSGDTFSVQVRPPIYMNGIYSWSFTTGSGSITSLPSSTSTTPLGALGIVPVDAALEILEVFPGIRDNVPLDTRIITIQFNKDIDADTVTDDAITVVGLPVNGDDDIPSPGVLGKILSVVDDKIYIILQSGEDPS